MATIVGCVQNFACSVECTCIAVEKMDTNYKYVFCAAVETAQFGFNAFAGEWRCDMRAQRNGTLVDTDGLNFEK